MISISQTELDELRDAKAQLQALENAGVDNWEGYDIALDEYHAKKEKIDKVYDTLDEIMDVLAPSVYEPSERGAGFAFRDEAIEQARNIIRKLV